MQHRSLLSTPCAPELPSSANYPGQGSSTLDLSAFSAIALPTAICLEISSSSCAFLLSAMVGGLRRHVNNVASTATPLMIAHTRRLSLNESEYVCLTACRWAGEREVPELWRLCSCPELSMRGPRSESRSCVPRMAVEAAMPMLPPRTRTWATMPWATAIGMAS